jgi:hypothetical protein
MYRNTAAVRRKRRLGRGFVLLVLVAAAVAIGYKVGYSRAGRSVTYEVETQPVSESEFAIIEEQIDSKNGTFSPSEIDLAQLKEQCVNYPEYKEEIEFFIEHIGAYSQEAVNTVLLSPEKTSFVLREPFAERTSTESVGKLSVRAGEVPLLLQYDERWAYHEYGSSVMGYTACGPTCLSMVAVALTGDGSLTPPYIADFAAQSGYYVSGVGTDWRLFSEGAQQLGLTSEIISLSEETMRARLDAGEVLVLSLNAGDFTMNGHFIVVRGYDDSGFLICDPSSEIRSAQSWTYERLAPQIAQIWAIGKG